MPPKKPTNETTSSRVATISSKVLRDGRYSDAAKSAAGSALAQAKPNNSGKKK